MGPPQGDGTFPDGDPYAGDGDPYAYRRPGTPDPYGDTGPAYSPPASPQPASGWDGVSIYSANGLVYPLRAGLDVAFDAEQMRQDILASQREVERRFGSPHTSNEGNMWVSQNIFRDMAAAYLGLDLTPNVRRYWALEKQINQQKRGCFTDVYNYGGGSISLDYYPRGIAAIGLVYALGGVVIDVPGKKISVAPLKTPLRLPLTTLADWENETVPWLVIQVKDGQVAAAVEPPELLRGFTLEERAGRAHWAPGQVEAR
jgi:hypothetical protein